MTMKVNWKCSKRCLRDGREPSVDISKWKLEIYDLLAIILPGLVVISEGWVLVRGWEAFAATITHLTGSGLTVLVLAAFGAGALLQGLNDSVGKSGEGGRFLR